MQRHSLFWCDYKQNIESLIDQFIPLFFSANLLAQKPNESRSKTNLLPCIISMICDYLAGKDIKNLRSVSFHFYNQIELNVKSRIKHRLYLIDCFHPLQLYIGRLIHCDNQYLLTHPAGDFQFRLIELNDPSQNLYCYIESNVYAYFGGYVRKDDNNQYTVLIAHQNLCPNDTIYVKEILVTSNSKKPIKSNSVTLKHEPLGNSNYPYLNWEIQAMIKMKDNHIKVNFNFMAKKPANPNIRHKDSYINTGLVEKYYAEYEADEQNQVVCLHKFT